MRVAHLPQRDRINEINVPRHQRGKRLLGIASGIFPQQRHVIRHHLTYTFTLRRKRDRVFSRLDSTGLFAKPLSKTVSAELSRMEALSMLLTEPRYDQILVLDQVFMPSIATVRNVKDE